LDRSDFDEKITQISKSIFSYCLTRTSDRYEAEDLAQDIIVELVKSVGNIRDDKAFYAFMWSVAGNVYAMWCRKKSRNATVELNDDFADDKNYFDVDNDDLFLLRRELSLLSEKYRKVVIAYYLDRKSCFEISSFLDISESMVKYLLFKARKILKDGISMERNYGEQSYNPKNLTIMYRGMGPNKFWGLINDKKIPQNILWACYNDNLSSEEISLQIGVALPYLETEIRILENAKLLIQKNGKYNTNIIIFTKEFNQELSEKVEKFQEKIADIIFNFIAINEEKIKNINFHMSDMTKNSFYWHVSCMFFWLLDTIIAKKYLHFDYPISAFGEKALVWGDECPNAIFNHCCLNKADDFLDEGEMRFLDYLPNIKSDNNYFCRNQKIAKLFIKLAKGATLDFNEYEKEFIADLIKNGYVKKDNDRFIVTTPVYTKNQINSLYSILQSMTEELSEYVDQIYKNAEIILINHIPLHLKKYLTEILCMRMFGDVIGASAEIMIRKDCLKTSWNALEMPTVFVVLD